MEDQPSNIPSKALERMKDKYNNPVQNTNIQRMDEGKPNGYSH